MHRFKRTNAPFIPEHAHRSLRHLQESAWEIKNRQKKTEHSNDKRKQTAEEYSGGLRAFCRNEKRKLFFLSIQPDCGASWKKESDRGSGTFNFEDCISYAEKRRIIQGMGKQLLSNKDKGK